MKKLITIFCIAAVLANSALLTGCNSGKIEQNNSNNSENSSAVINNSEKSTTADNSENNSAASIDPAEKFTGEALKLYNELKVTSFVGPDGKTVETSEAVDIYDSGIDIFLNKNGAGGNETTSTLLKYDFAYIRYARPYFYFADEYPDDAKDKELEEEAKKLPECEWFKVRAGDKLDCGLTVKRAEYLHYPTNYLGNALNKMEVEFDGELTMEGVLYVNIQNHDYMFSAGDVMFIPDPTKTDGIPAMSYNYWFERDRDEIFRAGLPSKQVGYPGGYVESDIGEEWSLGNIEDINLPIPGITNGSNAKVRITLNNIVGTVENTFPLYTQFTANIVDIEEI